MVSDDGHSSYTVICLLNPWAIETRQIINNQYRNGICDRLDLLFAFILTCLSGSEIPETSGHVWLVTTQVQTCSVFPPLR